MSKTFLIFFSFFFFFINSYTSFAKEKDFIVSSANPIATKIGKNILKNNGNAMDAAIAIQLILNLTEPQSSGIGGGGFLLYYNKKENKLHFYDGRETAPLNIKKEYFLNKKNEPLKFYDAAIGGISVGVPGLLSMLEMAHIDNGNLNWSELFKPAIKLSKKGFPISPRLYEKIKNDKYLYLMSSTKKYFYLDEEPKQIGYLLKNPKFAYSLESIAQNGSNSFYNGELAEEIIKQIRNAPIRKGIMNLEDLSNYKAVKRKPLCKKYKNYKICTAPLPSGGGMTILQVLGVLEKFQLSRETIKNDIHLIIEASKYAYLDRYKYLGDPDFNQLDANELLSEEYLNKIAKKIRNKEIVKINLEKNIEKVERSTTHFSIYDNDGNVVSMTSSIENSFGSRLMAGGFLLNNQLTDFDFKSKNGLHMNNLVEPNKRPLSSMSPTIIFDNNNNVKMAIGSPGGKSIPMYIIKTIVAVLEWEMGIQEAVDFPNFSLGKNHIFLEKNKFNKKIKNYLVNLGYSIKEKDLNSGLHGFTIKNQEVSGAADFRREGLFLTK